jgi:hypothetical protein
MAPVPAPISNTDESAGHTVDAISLQSLGELGASAPIAFGFNSSERKKREDAGDGKIMGYLEDNRVAAHPREPPALLNVRVSQLCRDCVQLLSWPARFYVI